MRKILALVLALATIFALTAYASAAVPKGFNGGEHIQVSKNVYDDFAATKESANNNTVKNVGGVVGIDFVCSNKEGWYLNVTDAGLKGVIEVAYKISSDYFIAVFEIDGIGNHYVGDGSGKNGISHAKVGEFDECIIVDPFEFSITVYHRFADTGGYLYNPGVGETFSNTQEEYSEWLNAADGVTFINLYLVATRNNNDVVMSLINGYVCASVEKNNPADENFSLTQIGNGEGIEAIINPLIAGHYEFTFWYDAQPN